MRQDHPGAPLITALARSLARFRTTRRGGLLHIGRDLELCGYEHDPRFARPCSPRCAEITALLEHAADYLGCTVADFSAPVGRSAKRPDLVRSRQLHTSGRAVLDTPPTVAQEG